MDRAAEARKLIEDDKLTGKLLSFVGHIDDQQEKCQQLVETADKHGLGPNLVAQDCMPMMKQRFYELRSFLDDCIKQCNEYGRDEDASQD